jgi:hypothetical protein
MSGGIPTRITMGCGRLLVNPGSRIVGVRLDRITIAIRGTFRFTEVFPKSKKLEYRQKLDRAQF